MQGPPAAGSAHSHAPDVPLPDPAPDSRTPMGAARAASGGGKRKSEGGRRKSTESSGVPSRRSVTRAQRLDDLEFSGGSDSD